MCQPQSLVCTSPARCQVPLDVESVSRPHLTRGANRNTWKQQPSPGPPENQTELTSAKPVPGLEGSHSVHRQGTDSWTTPRVAPSLSRRVRRNWELPGAAPLILAQAKGLRHSPTHLLWLWAPSDQEGWQEHRKLLVQAEKRIHRAEFSGQSQWTLGRGLA